MKQSALLLVALLSVGLMFGCEREDGRVETTDGPAERTGEQIDRAAERTGEALERGAERTGEALERGAERTGEAIDRTAERTDEAIDRTDADARPAGERVTDAVADAEHDRIYQTLAETVEAAVKVGTFDDMVERFAPQDRQRFQQLGADTLNAEAQPFINNWQTQHGQFDINNPREVFGQIARVEMAGENQARVTLQPQAGQQQVTLNMIRDNMNWFIDVPEQVDPQTLRNNLATELRALGEQQANLPQDQVQAQREVARRVLAALAQPGQPGAGQ